MQASRSMCCQSPTARSVSRSRCASLRRSSSCCLCCCSRARSLANKLRFRALIDRVNPSAISLQYDENMPNGYYDMPSNPEQDGDSTTSNQTLPFALDAGR